MRGLIVEHNSYFLYYYVFYSKVVPTVDYSKTYNVPWW